MTPVQRAVAVNRLAMLDILLEAGADANASGGPCNALDMAYIGGRREAIAMLEKRGARRSASCAASSDDALAKRATALRPAMPPDPLLGRDWSIDACNQTRALTAWSSTQPEPSAVATRTSNLEACYGLFHMRNDVLLSCARQRIDFEQTCRESLDDAPRKPLDVAIARMNVDAVKALLAAGADAKSPTSWVALNLSYCAEASQINKCREIVSLLVRHGASIDAPHSITEGRGVTTMVARAANPHNTAMLDVLLELGADINASSDPCNLLDRAYIRHSKEEIEMLEKRGARQTLTCQLSRVDPLDIVRLPLCLLLGCRRF